MRDIDDKEIDKSGFDDLLTVKSGMVKTVREQKYTLYKEKKYGNPIRKTGRP